MVRGAGSRNGEWRKRESMCGKFSSQNREGSAVNHMNCLAPAWKEKERRSVGFAWGFTCPITLGYQMDLETKCHREQ